MSDSQELQVQQKREVEKKTESTTPGRVFVPVTDIFETPDAPSSKTVAYALCRKHLMSQWVVWPR